MMFYAALASLVLLVLFVAQLARSLRTVPRTSDEPFDPAALPSLTIIVPAYNEQANIADCVRSISRSTARREGVQIVVVDDESVDGTAAELARVEEELGDPRLIVMRSGPRPPEPWLGKSWACNRAMTIATGEYVLFVDADVRLREGGPDRALAAAVREQAGLFSVVPEVVCSNPSELLVQPLMVAFMGLRFDARALHDPKNPLAFACGPFLLFRRDTYERVGGHRAVAREVVEDVVLARLTKAVGDRLRVFRGDGIAEVDMYPNFRALWEGWTRTIFFALGENVLASLATAAFVAFLFVFPAFALGYGAATQDVPTVAVSIGAILAQVIVRLVLQRYLGMTTAAWWATPAGGLLVSAMVVSSAIKWTTGRGWTWRGRALTGIARS